MCCCMKWLALIGFLGFASSNDIDDKKFQKFIKILNSLQEIESMSFHVDFGNETGCPLFGEGVVSSCSKIAGSINSEPFTNTTSKVDVRLRTNHAMIISGMERQLNDESTTTMSTSATTTPCPKKSCWEDDLSSWGRRSSKRFHGWRGTNYKVVQLGKSEITFHIDRARGAGSSVPSVDLHVTSLDLALSSAKVNGKSLAGRDLESLRRVLEMKLLPVVRKNLNLSLPKGRRKRINNDLLLQLMHNVYQAYVQEI